MKLPLNVTGQTLQTSGLGLVEGAARQIAAKRSGEPLTPETADAILRAYRRGGTGLALMA